jgi:hypothetical protein
MIFLFLTFFIYFDERGVAFIKIPVEYRPALLGG